MSDETASLSDGASDGDGGDGPPPGGTIGRFVIIGLLGRGGMGVVLSAYDPLLDRRVALKLVRPGAWSSAGVSEGRARLQREAQAMARLSHPNVVAVHDVGAVSGQLFIAMEFVDGQTLNAWLAAEKRSWREIVRLFLAAGHGLEAAHAAGLVHRDFKPENVLIGKDGRARVGDFGLVSVTRPTPGAAEPSDAGETRQGAMLGTPGYMSPEQLRGEASGAQSDQFSFCVALYEALYGKRPFPVEPSRYREAVLAGGAEPAPRRSDVPRWLAEVIARGLAAQPEARWPSMTALLAELGRDPERARRRGLRAAAIVVGLGALAAAVRLAQKPAPAVCTGAAARLAGVWDEDRRQAAERVFTATQLPFAHDTFVKVAAALDRYTGAWVTMHDEACRATRVEGRQSDGLLDLRMACLERRRATLGALTAEWARGVDAQALENAIQATASLPPLDECADARALTERVPAPRDPAALARIEAVRAHLDRARALADTRRMQEARVEAERARKEADDAGFVPSRAEAAFLLGRSIHDFGEPGAVEPLEDATRLAEQARDDRLAASAVVEMTSAMADGGLAPAAILMSSVAEALVVRAGDRPEQRGRLLIARGTALLNVGRNTEALAALTEARAVFSRALGAKDPATLDAIFKMTEALGRTGDYTARNTLADELLATETEVLGADHPQVGILLGRMALHACRVGEYALSRTRVARAIAIAERSFGPSSLRTAQAVNVLGVLEETEGHLDEAARHYSRVLAIRRALVAPDNPLVAHALANLSIITRLQGKLDDALLQIQTALAIMRRTYGPLHPDVAFETGLLGAVLEDRGDVGGARARYQEAVDTYALAAGPQHHDTLGAMVARAEFESRHDGCDEARKLMTAARTIYERDAVKEDTQLALALVILARCDLERGAPAEAQKELERALELQERPGVPPAQRAITRFELARALGAAGSRARARTLALQAERELAQSGPLGARDLGRARSWLARFEN